MHVLWRKAGIFVLGAAAGGISAGWLVGHEDVVRSLWERQTARTLPGKPAEKAAILQEAPCPGVASVEKSSGEDGQFKLVDTIANKRDTDVRGLIVIGKDAAASRRARDAEIAFIMACRVATQLDADPLVLADAKYQLGWHYGNLARDATGTVRDDLASRARPFYGDALRIYTARLGRDNEKSKFAASGLAALQQAEPSQQQVAVAPQPGPAPQPEAAPQAAATPKKEQQVATAAAPAVRAASTAAERRNDTRISGSSGSIARPATRTERAAAKPASEHPSFDCARAHSRTERLICHDRQLAQLDRELGHLHARAQAHAANPADFKRRSDAEWRRREATCRDRQCLLAWYAKRRAELLDEIDAQRG